MKLRLEDIEVLSRSYEGPCAWFDGRFRDRVEKLVPAPREAGALGGTLLRTRRAVEECPTLDGTRATVGAFERLEGALLFVPMASVDCRVRMRLASARGAQRVVVFADDAPAATVELPAEGACAVELDVAPTRRGLRLTVAAALDVPAGEVVSDEPRVLAQGEAAVEVLSVEVEAADRRPGERRSVFVAADSLAQTYPDGVRPQTGWAEFLARYLGCEPCAAVHDDAFPYEAATRYEGPAGPVVRNAAMAARSFRSFIAEGKLARLLGEVRPGDVVVLQFGANDATCARPLRYSSLDDFQALLARYVDSIRDRGAVPVVVTPPPRHNFAEGRLVEDFASYSEVERAYCAREGVALVDLSREGGLLVDGMGPERSRCLYMKLSAGQYERYPGGVDDSTHLSALGARLFGRIVAKGIAEACGLGFRDDGAPLGAEPPANLSADVEAQGRAGVRLAWDAVPGADYYTIARSDGRGNEVTATSLEPRFFDIAVPGDAGEHRYEVRAWQGNESGEPAAIAVDCPFGSLAADRRIEGVDLYEVDPDGVADRIAFSVRFVPVRDVASYRVLARNARTGQLTVLGDIAAAEADGLHSYGVSREPGWEIHVEADGPDGPLRSDAVALPDDLCAAGARRSSWEIPF